MRKGGVKGSEDRRRETEAGVGKAGRLLAVGPSDVKIRFTTVSFEQKIYVQLS
ncbi:MULTISPECIES: hypothetical protein [unclassified Imperialibacter]|uniref:hypothetical protein n=1 Tax=unclassified Imperialibacter TaxID=2629706 RepID=UPI001254CE50|nr:MULTISPECIES: hypothetical protein [unclassified Imperialibacter]CAD5278791.1 hypothetical protein IMPERIA89_450125 [Imperialibacter sp. 89]CAD5292929.1 hypothetical protein IMPERIA75_650124 [Imperialibacter sp. 75]VVS99307.1 hypothetical protein IMPR6_100068 [Imperialibacter sp. EC-SDR9]